jgi:hypothetical protein
MPYTPSVKNVHRPSWLDRLIAPSNHRPQAIARARSDQNRPCQKGFIPLGDVHQGALVAHQRLDDRGIPTVPYCMSNVVVDVVYK